MHHQTKWPVQFRLVGWMTGCTLATVLFLPGCQNDTAVERASAFVPKDFPVPLGFEAPEFKLRPLKTSDAQLDYDAVMASAEKLRQQLQGDWPRDDFTVEENAAQLKIHEQQFTERTAFVYTVIRPDETQVLGCVYVCPSDSPKYDATVTYWVRDTQEPPDLPKRLGDTLRRWIRDEWPFRNVQFASSP